MSTIKAFKDLRTLNNNMVPSIPDINVNYRWASFFEVFNNIRAEGDEGKLLITIQKFKISLK